MKNENELSELLANNWFYHDKKEYREIQKNSLKLLNKLRYDNSEKASVLISRLFFDADKAELNPGKEELIYEKIYFNCNKIDSLLNRKTNSWKEVRWWRAIRHRQLLRAHLYLFLDQLSKFGSFRFFQALKATIHLAKAGYAHDKKKWDLVKKHLIKYWKIINANKLNNFLEF